MASVVLLCTIIFAILAAIATALPAFQVPGINMLESNDEPIIEKRVPHPSWRSNVRINHIQHHDASPFLSYEAPARPFFNQWAMRPYQ